MKIMKYMLGCGLAVCVTLFASCRQEEEPAGTAADGLRAVFGVETRSGSEETVGDNGNKLVRLFVANRAQEEETDGNSLGLYCPESHRYTLERNENGGWNYIVEGLTAQWYKFAFVCVPDGLGNGIKGDDLFLEEHTAGEAEDEPVSDFTRLTVDYAPLMEYQQEHAAVYSGESNPDKDDLHVYRKVINRWLVAGEDLEENDLGMSRITGLLSFDMGILTDQFENEITQITVTLEDVPLRAYIYDNAIREDEGEVYTTDTRDFVFSYDVEQIAESITEHCRFDIAMLPGLVRGTVTLGFDGTGGQTTYQFNIGTAGGGISVKPNTRTSILFNGMTTNQFEVRYAGFDEKAAIGVADDEWDGWNN